MGHPPRRVLNVGCGPDTYGTSRVDLHRASAATELASALALPYRSGVFGEVRAANVLEHMPNPLLFLEEAARVLAPGGRLVLVTDHAGYAGYHFVGLRPGDNHRWHGARGDRHYMLFTPAHLRNLCEAAGLRVLRTELFTKWRPTLLARLLALVARPLAMANVLVEAEKPARP